MAKIIGGRIIINNKQVMSRLGDENWLHQRPTPYMDAGIPKMGSVCEESDGKLGVPYFLAKPLFICFCVRVSFLIQSLGDKRAPYLAYHPHLIQTRIHSPHQEPPGKHLEGYHSLAFSETSCKPFWSTASTTIIPQTIAKLTDNLHKVDKGKLKQDPTVPAGSPTSMAKNCREHEVARCWGEFASCSSSSSASESSVNQLFAEILYNLAVETNDLYAARQRKVPDSRCNVKILWVIILQLQHSSHSDWVADLEDVLLDLSLGQGSFSKPFPTSFDDGPL